VRAQEFDDEWVNEKVVPLRAGTHTPAALPLPRMSIADTLRLLLREWAIIGVVFMVIFGLGAAVAMKMPKSYTASASLLMQLGPDYVYQPPAGDAARGATATIDEVVQSETEILNSQEVKKRVIAKVGYKTILPRDPELWNPKSDVARAASDEAALKVLQGGFETATAPANPVVRLSFKHEDPEAASLILNTIIDEYRAYRLHGHDELGPVLARQKADFDQRLAEADAAYQAFLQQNGVGDYDAAKATYSKIFDQVQTDLFTTRAQISQDQTRLSEVEANLATLSPEVSTERDLDLSVPNKIFTLKQQRQDLLSRYLPDAQPVKDIDAQIASYQALLDSGQGIGESSHKMGTNTIYQAVVQQKLDVEAEMAALKGRVGQLEAQSDEITHKLQTLQGIEGEYTSLATERSALQDNVKSFTQRIQENDAANAVTSGADDTVRVVEKATPPDKPKSFKKIVLIMSLLFGAFTGICAGLLRVYTRKGFASATMASRTLDLPVLAQAGVKAA